MSLRPPRSTTVAKPTFRRPVATIARRILAIIQPISRMTRNATSLGTKLATDVQAEDSPPLMSMAASVVVGITALLSFRRPFGIDALLSLLPMRATTTHAINVQVKQRHERV